ncbi:hypothetical protein QWY77_06205 [Thalassotalea ponticola]|uniref:hypothetical protein n=1 Tax=Thalassotalea ponticola TaxID=1523392 RepID=UPI0025B5C3C7|nr:hypothetical protein [Thalassotalea ponticola]MDN3652353.1 hypothetical protein [Thalassotalea ponticola]
MPLNSGAKSNHSQGIGDGLNLIKRVAELCGWSVNVATTNDEFHLSIQITADEI